MATRKDELLSQQGNRQRRLTKDESDLRYQADKRETLQMYIDRIVKERLQLNRTLEQLHLYHTWFIGWFKKHKTPDTEPHSATSPWTPSMKQLAEFETLILDIPRITAIPAQHLQLPTTGEIMNHVTQGQPSNRSTYQDEGDKATYIRQELILRCQETIRHHYQEQFSLHHPEEAFFEDPQCMPQKIKMTLLSKMALEPLEQGKFFPGTGVSNVVGVVVEADSTLGDRIICE